MERLDLNMKCNKKVVETVWGIGGQNKAGNGVEEVIDGVGFFEGVDEFLSSLPMLCGHC